MEEKVGWRRAFSAAVILGLYSGFMLTIGILMTLGNDSFKEAFFLWALTIVLSALLITPLLAGSRKRGRENSIVYVDQVRDLLSEYNEGKGKWRTISHVRNSGAGVLISLSNSSNPLLIIDKISKTEISFKLIFRFSKTESDLRDRTLIILEEKFANSRVEKKSKSIHVNPKVEFDKNAVITKSMMICPPLMLIGAIGLQDLISNLIISSILGSFIGAFLGVLIITNRVR